MEVNPTGHAGVTISAMSSLDVACWDIVGRAAELPLHKLFGACRDTVDTYASSGLWLDATARRHRRRSRFVRRAGLHRGQAADRQRPRRRRRRARPGGPIGDRATVSGCWSTPIRSSSRRTPSASAACSSHTTSAGSRSPSPSTTFAVAPRCAPRWTSRSRRVRRSTRARGLKSVLDARAADIVMPDLQRVGGYTEFRRAAALAAADDTPVSSHFFTEYSLSVAAATPNCISVEHVDWFAPLFAESVELRDGRARRPGPPRHRVHVPLSPSADVCVGEALSTSSPTPCDGGGGAICGGEVGRVGPMVCQGSRRTISSTTTSG